MTATQVAGMGIADHVVAENVAAVRDLLTTNLSDGEKMIGRRERRIRDATAYALIESPAAPCPADSD